MGGRLRIGSLKSGWIAITGGVAADSVAFCVRNGWSHFLRRSLDSRANI